MSETEKNANTSDVLIIGAGPTGLFAIFQCGMMGFSCQVVDALPEIGGQCTALYPEKPIYDIPAAPMVSAAELIARLETQAKPFKPVYHLDQKVESLQRQGSLWHLTTSAGNILKAKAIIIAGGAGSFGPNRPPLKDIETYEGRAVFYMVRERENFIGKNILIAGGGDSAVDWALALQPIAKSVRLVHRRDKFRAAPESVQKLHKLAENGHIDLLTPYQLHALEGDAGELKRVILKHTDKSTKAVDTDILLPFFGLSADLGPIKKWNLELQGSTIKTCATTARTNIEGIYAIGDIAAYENKRKLILTGFSEAAFAADDIYRLLHPYTPHHFEYSTTKGLP
jgi:thioredoxin reductase (NADPH)